MALWKALNAIAWIVSGIWSRSMYSGAPDLGTRSFTHGASIVGQLLDFHLQRATERNITGTRLSGTFHVFDSLFDVKYGNISVRIMYMWILSGTWNAHAMGVLRGILGEEGSELAGLIWWHSGVSTTLHAMKRVALTSGADMVDADREEAIDELSEALSALALSQEGLAFGTRHAKCSGWFPFCIGFQNCPRTWRPGRLSSGITTLSCLVAEIPGMAHRAKA
ncbi:hypothetical protein FIBSPDRAFT_976967 [Athelia psychrophila]|uniref:Uncharacterized protein n=1 Tax=Athelia psychrophila TaxID=1759441 RepID=A0A166TVH5_9AGAM|nr:hypothetical protein FIBSPDRAFT_976967 [Fibularhizoctonia sp. CBS 109695]